MKETSIKVNTDFSQSGDPSLIKHEDISDRVALGSFKQSLDSFDRLKLSQTPLRVIQKEPVTIINKQVKLF